MNQALIDQVVNAVLYEGYILYPYRSSSKKNQRERFTFGRVYPEAYSAAQAGAERCEMQTECLVLGRTGASHEVNDLSSEGKSLAPKGASDNGAAFERRDQPQRRTSPEGTAERRGQPAVPSGLNFFDPCPGVETPGYSQKSLRDAAPRSVSTVNVCIRFLQPIWREVFVLDEAVSELPTAELPSGKVVSEFASAETRYQTWQEAVEREISVTLDGDERQENFSFTAFREIEAIRDQQGCIVAALLRRGEEISGLVQVCRERLNEDVFKVTARIVNQSPLANSDLGSADAILMRTLASTHAILHARGGEFISLMDPPPDLKEAAAGCQNIGVWPVLVGDESAGERDTMLSSPIILYDYPKIAPESAGDLFDGTEIDEILTLRIMTMTDEEKREMRNVDAHARRLLERTEAMGSEALLKLHGSMRPIGSFDEQIFGSNQRLEGVSIEEVYVRPGDRVRVRPKGRADVMDMAIAGRIAVIEAVEQDAEARVHLALVLEDDPGKDLGLLRQPGHRFFYGVDEVEPLAGNGK